MDRSERLLSLLAGLASAREPVPWYVIRDWFPADYGEASDEAAIRKFERDKADLLELGVPLRFRELDEDVDGGYVVDAAELYLPELRLDEDEAATVYLSGLALLSRPGFPYRDALAMALRKLDLAASGHGSRAAWAGRAAADHLGPGVDEDERRRIERLGQALVGRKRASLSYTAWSSGESTRRDVDPWGLYCRRGEWVLVGYCHLRSAPRSFLVRRIRDLAVNEKRPGTPDFEVPAGFLVEDWAQLPPWRWEVHAPVRVVLAAEPGFEFLVEREVQGAGPSGGPWEIEATNTQALVDWVLGVGSHVRIVSPPEVCARVKAGLEAMLAAATSPTPATEVR